MSILTVVSKTSQQYRTPSRLRKPDFNARIAGARLFVPQEIATVLERLSVRTADEFVSSTYTYPSLMANELGWNLEDFMKARQKLVEQLRGLVASDILVPPLYSTHAYGVVGSLPTFGLVQTKRRGRATSRLAAASHPKRKSFKPRYKTSIAAGPKPLGRTVHGKKAIV